MGVLVALGLDVPNFTNDELNFIKNVLRVPKCVLRWGSTSNDFLMGSQMK